MELKYFGSMAGSGYEGDIRGLLAMADREFIPPLSSRGSPTQPGFGGGAAHDGILDYYASMAQQPAVLALEEGRCMGFMAFKVDYTCDVIGPENCPNLYASTCVVHPDTRGKGLMRRFYTEMIRLFPGRSIFTRTWHTNASHLHVLDTLGFREYARLKDHRAPGLDTVYFHRSAKA